MTAASGASNHPLGAYGLVNAIVGKFTAPNSPSVMLHGDSIFSFGQGPASPGWNEAAGSLATKSYPGNLCARIGAGMKGYAETHAYRDQLSAHTNAAIVEDRTNDIITYSQSLTQITSNTGMLFATLRTSEIK